MSELAGFGTSWLPPAVQRRIAAEERAEQREAHRAEQDQEERREKLHDRALQAYSAAADQRGEVVSAMALATGQDIGRSIGDVFADARAAAEREDGRAAARQRREDGDVIFINSEPVIHTAARSGWPASEYELDRTLRQAEELHRDFVAYRARTNYPEALEAARDKSDPFVERAAAPGREIYR